jgi:methyltransferase (TIGR00027 family)
MERTDNDSWDLATSVGATATMVAAARAHATAAPDPLIDDPFAAPLVQAVGVDFFTRWASGELDPADVDIEGEPWGLQKMTDLLTARTRYFDEFLLGATASGIRQVVILASGLDARGYRVAWPTDTTVFQIDQPQVVDFLTTTMASLGASPTADLRSVPIDLRDDWPAALQAAGFDSGLPTAWIAEGLLPFLPSEAQDRLLDNITHLSAPGSRLATEVALVDNNTFDESAQSQMNDVTESWREHGFDLEFGDLGYAGERNDVDEYLDARGWRSARTPLRELLAANGLGAFPVGHDGEAVFADNYYCASVKEH